MLPDPPGAAVDHALHAWFDNHLAQRNVDASPPGELFLSKGTFEGARTGDRAQVLVNERWPVADGTYLTLHPAASAVPGADGPLSPGQPLGP